MTLEFVDQVQECDELIEQVSEPKLRCALEHKLLLISVAHYQRVEAAFQDGIDFADGHKER